MIQGTSRKRKPAHRSECRLNAEKGRAVAQNSAITPETNDLQVALMWATKRYALVVAGEPFSALINNPALTAGEYPSINREKNTA